MTAPQPAPTHPCDLCGLAVERDDFPIRTAERTLHFCCDGCRGIFRMLHQPEELPAQSLKEESGG